MKHQQKKPILLAGLLAASVLLSACTSMQTHETPPPIITNAATTATTASVSATSPTVTTSAMTTSATTKATTRAATSAPPETTAATSATEPPEGEIARAVEKAARDVLGRSYAYIDSAVLSEMKYLDIRFDYDRTNWNGALNGLEYCTNLKTLCLTMYQGESLEFLNALPQLETLSIRFGGEWASEYPYDLTPVARLTHLKRLELTNCTALDLTPIGSMTWLEELWLAGDAVDDLSPLAGLTELRGLSLGHYTAHGVNMVTDLSPLAGMKQLEFLRLVYCNGSLSAIRDLPIRSLVLSFCGLDGFDRLPGTVESLLLTDSGFADSDVSQLKKLSRLEYLILGQPVGDTAALQTLGLKGCYNGGDETSGNFWEFPGENNSRLTRYGMLRDMASEGVISPELDMAVKRAVGREADEALLASVEALDLRFAYDKPAWEGTELLGIERCTGLKSLRVERYQGSDVEFLRDLPQLEALSLDLVQPGFAEMPLGEEYDLTPLKALKNLKYLTLSGPVLDMDLIGSLTTLESLELNTCWYTDDDLSPLGRLKNLRALAICPNNWWESDLSALAALKQLRALKLDYYRGDSAFLRDLPLKTLLVKTDTVDLDDLPATLETLELWCAQLDPADLPKLRRLTNLKTIHVPFNTPEARNAFPGVEWAETSLNWDVSPF